MASHAPLARRMTELLRLDRLPVGVAFLASPPPGVARIAAAGPAGCAYWRRAAEGHVFYTEAADHMNCPVGAHTHGIDLPPERAAELTQVVGTMVGLHYIDAREVATLPRRAAPFGVAVYAPLAALPCAADVAIVRGSARQVMVLAEAAQAAGATHPGPAMGRPACAMLPEAMQAATGITSLGCVGNRVYTGIGDGELYFAVPGARLAEVVDRLATKVAANDTLEGYHRARLG